jgi:hypothetical protein
MSKGVYPSAQVKRPLIDVPMYQKWNLLGLLDPALLGPAMILDTFGAVVAGGSCSGSVLGPASSCWKGCVSRCANSGRNFRIAVATSLIISPLLPTTNEVRNRLTIPPLSSKTCSDSQSYKPIPSPLKSSSQPKR